MSAEKLLHFDYKITKTLTDDQDNEHAFIQQILFHFDT